MSVNVRWGVGLAAVSAGLILSACSSPAPVSAPSGVGGSAASTAAPSSASSQEGDVVGSTEYCDRLKAVEKAKKSIEKDNSNMKAQQAYSDGFLSAAEVAPNDLAVWMTALAEVTVVPERGAKGPSPETFEFVFANAGQYFSQIEQDCGLDLAMGGGS